MVIKACPGPSWLDTLDEDWVWDRELSVPTFEMNATDGDDDWTVPWYEPNLRTEEEEPKVMNVRAVQAQGMEVEVVVDSGADISVAPRSFGQLGSPAASAAVVMHDAQGRRIPELGTRILDLEVRSTEGEAVTIREKFAVANVGSLILSLGRLLRWGWELGHEGSGPVIKRDGCRLPIRLRRNTLTMLGVVSMISASLVNPEAAKVHATSVFDDFGPLPPEAEDLMTRPGWHILGSGLPFLVTHKTEALHLEQSLWSSEDWAWAAVFVRAEKATRLPRAGDLWTQAATIKTGELVGLPDQLTELNDDLVGPRDVCVLFHVDQLPSDLLSQPREFFKENADDSGSMDVVVPPECEEGGVGAMPEEVVGAERDLEEKEPEGEVMDGIALSVETPLRDLRGLCERQGLPTSGSKGKVLRRLKQHYEVLERQMAGQLAHKLYMEEDRPPDLPRAPRLPSARQQELHSVTHQPYANWCEACVLGRAKASPHPRQEVAAEQGREDKDRGLSLFQIDYAYTFTKKREEEQEAQEEESEEKIDPVDYQDQYGLTLVGAEELTGWCISIPVLQKGSAALRRVVEQLTRQTLQVCPAGPIIFQGDPEPSIKQIVNAVAACRSKLGLETQARFVPRGSHQSNGMVEKTVQTVRNGGRTLRAYLEDRCRVKVEGHNHIFSWAMRRAGFIHNRFSRAVRGAPPYEIVFGRRFKGVLLPFGEQCLFHFPSRHKGDMQWRRGIYAGHNERNGASILLTPDGAFESRSLRRLPAEEQWNGEMVLAAKGLPWDYQGLKKRKRPLYTSARTALVPDSASLEELARAAGVAAAEAIASNTPRPAAADEAGSDSPSRSSSTSSSAEREQGGDPDERPGGAGEDGTADGPTSDGMDTSTGRGALERPAETRGGSEPKRPRLLLDRPPGSSASPSAPAQAEQQQESQGGGTGASGSLYPPTFAGVREVTGDVPMDELAEFELWGGEVATYENSLDLEDGMPDWDPNADRPPELEGEELDKVDRAADLTEVTRLLEMGVLRRPADGENTESYTRLTTKVVRDWRRRPGWTRRSRLVAREFRTGSPWTEELFAPASSLGVVHSFLVWAISAGLEVVSLDIKDAYLQVPQPSPAIITVDARIFSEEATGQVTYVLERLLPGQRVGARYNYAKEMLEVAGVENFVKEPTLFRSQRGKDRAGLILHADDGLLASSPKERERLLRSIGAKVSIQMSSPLLRVGDEIEFLKRRYVLTEEGLVVFPSNRYAEALFAGVGKEAKVRDTPADASFLEIDSSEELDGDKARLYREATGRLLYLSHSRGDIQFATCILASKMAKPTRTSWRWLQRVIGCLKKVPMFGILLRPARSEACLGYGGGASDLQPGSKVVVEAVTDADWAGDKQTRRSRTAIQIYVAGSMVASFVRSQRSIALSSGESEFIALVGGASEALYVGDCLKFLVEGEELEVEVRSRSDFAACRGIAQRVGCGRIRHLDASLLWVQLAVKGKRLVIGTVAGSMNPADIGTKPLAGPRLRELMFLMGGRTPDLEPYGEQDHNEACAKRGMAKVFKEIRESGAAVSVNTIKRHLPLMILLCQAAQVEGLSLAGPLLAMIDDEFASLVLTTAVLGLLCIMVFLGFPFCCLWLARRLCCLWRGERKTAQGKAGEEAREASVQANMGLSKTEERFQQEYIDRTVELRQIVAEQRDELNKFERQVRTLREEKRALERELTLARARAVPPEQIAIAPARGERYHLPSCGNIRHSTTRVYTPCNACMNRLI